MSSNEKRNGGGKSRIEKNQGRDYAKKCEKVVERVNKNKKHDNSSIAITSASAMNNKKNGKINGSDFVTVAKGEKVQYNPSIHSISMGDEFKLKKTF